MGRDILFPDEEKLELASALVRGITGRPFPGRVVVDNSIKVYGLAPDKDGISRIRVEGMSLTHVAKIVRHEMHHGENQEESREMWRRGIHDDRATTVGEMVAKKITTVPLKDLEGKKWFGDFLILGWENEQVYTDRWSERRIRAEMAFLGDRMGWIEKERASQPFWGEHLKDITAGRLPEGIVGKAAFELTYEQPQLAYEWADETELEKRQRKQRLRELVELREVYDVSTRKYHGHGFWHEIY